MSEHLTSTRVPVFVRYECANNRFPASATWRCVVHAGPKRPYFWHQGESGLVFFSVDSARNTSGCWLGTRQHFDTVDMKIYVVLRIGHVLCTGRVGVTAYSRLV